MDAKGDDQGAGGEETRAYRLEGRVQGVGFRWWSSRQGDSLGVRGWVRNLPDGTVELHAAGAPDTLDELESALERGPRGARVTRLERTGPGEDLPERGFEIRSTPGRRW